MSELDDRYERGQETRKMFGGEQITCGSSPGAWDIAPDLERILGEALFGDIWRRPALTLAHLCKEVFEERGIDFTPTRIHDTSEEPDSLFQRGERFRLLWRGLA